MLQTVLCPFTGGEIDISSESGNVLSYMRTYGTAKEFSALVLKTAGIVNPTALQWEVAFFGSKITGNINQTCMNEELLALNVSKIQSCATAVLFTNKLAQKEGVDKEHVS